MFKRAVITALIVGSILTVINQVDAVFGQAELIICRHFCRRPCPSSFRL